MHSPDLPLRSTCNPRGVSLVVLSLFLAVCSQLLTSCRKSGGTESEAPSAKAGVKTYTLTGEIISVAADRQRLVVKHDAIPDYMPAMTMEFTVSPGALANAKPGQHIRAELIPSETGDFRLEKIWPADPTAATTVEAAARALAEDTNIRGKNAYREVGEAAPNFTLFNQNGEVVSFAKFRGKQVLLNFVFTRCPVATMCPAAVARFQQVQKQVAEKGLKDVELVSISLDPTYDTPAVLKDYVLQRGIDTSNYSFLTGPDGAIKALLAQFGVLAEFEGDLLKHTLATVLIDGNGKIIWRADGSSWTVAEFVDKMK